MTGAMLRFAVLTLAVLALAASASDPYSFNQRGTVATPRAAHYDGQPLEGSSSLEGHVATTVRSAIDQPGGAITRQVEGRESGAAVARNEAGAALRFRTGASADVGLEVDGAWGPTARTRQGDLVDAPDDAVLDVALAVRGSTRTGDGGLRLGWVANLGVHSTPIERDGGGGAQRDEALLFRAAIVPSLRRGAVTLFASLGLASETDVPAVVVVAGGADDPGVQAHAVGAAFTAAAGATVDLGRGARLTGRIGDAFSGRGAASHYGPQVDVGLAFDLGQ